MPKIDPLFITAVKAVAVDCSDVFATNMAKITLAAIEEAERYKKDDLEGLELWEDFDRLYEMLDLSEAQSKAFHRLQSKAFRTIREYQRTAAVRAVLEVTGGGE